eukprot:g23189.t1
MVRNWKVLSFVVNRVQVLYKAVSKSVLGLTSVEEAILGAADSVDCISGYAGEPLSDEKCLFGSLDGVQWGGVRAVANHFNSTSNSLGDLSILGLLQCHNDTTWKLEEQHLIFCLGSLQPNGLNVDFT